jgi:hypothetical protein
MMVDFDCSVGPLFFIQLLACAGNQSGTSVFFAADAPARYHAWDEFLHLHLHVLILSCGCAGYVL